MDDIRLYVSKKDNDFYLYENEKNLGKIEVKNYPKDEKYKIIYKLPENRLGRVWVAAGKMADGLEITEHAEKSTSANNVDNYNIFNKIKDFMAPEDVAILDDLKAKYIKIMKKLEYERQIADIQKKLEELGE